jgi:hypothetical protein
MALLLLLLLLMTTRSKWVGLTWCAAAAEDAAAGNDMRVQGQEDGWEDEGEGEGRGWEVEVQMDGEEGGCICFWKKLVGALLLMMRRCWLPRALAGERRGGRGGGME